MSQEQAVAAPPPPALTPLGRAKHFYEEHEAACTAAFFVAGFLFDTMAVGRIDKLHNVLHQASYLLLCAWLIGLELREVYGDFAPPPRLGTAWRYHEAATHFMLGTLLNIYTLFYFKSASFGASFLFLAVLAALLAVNELRPPFANSATTMRMALFSLCLTSYFTYLVPMLVGSIGPWPFAGSMAAAAGCVALLSWLLRRRLVAKESAVRDHVVIPFAGVLLGFALLYGLKLIPPVPLSLSAIGVYHDVKREGDLYALTMTRPRWRFWQRGDQTFDAWPGDKVHCFVSVFSPTRFKERLQVRWLYRDEARGWLQSDAIPLEISGGRDGGYRGETVKSKYKPGRWRVRIETSDGRELGRIDMVVRAAGGERPEGRTVYR